jgi:hypothetical protein
MPLLSFASAGCFSCEAQRKPAVARVSRSFGSMLCHKEKQAADKNGINM